MHNMYLAMRSIPKCILVLGTPRSGTSAVSGVLHHLGIDMGKRLLPACDCNPTGLWQDADFEDLFDSLHANQKTLKSLILKRCSQDQDWGLKCSKLYLIFDQLIRHCYHNIRLIITQRNHMHSKNSLKRHSEVVDPCPIKTIDSAIQNIARIVNQTDLPRIYVQYDSLIEDTRNEIYKVAEFIEKPVTNTAMLFIDPLLRNYA